MSPPVPLSTNSLKRARDGATSSTVRSSEYRWAMTLVYVAADAGAVAKVSGTNAAAPMDRAAVIEVRNSVRLGCLILDVFIVYASLQVSGTNHVQPSVSSFDKRARAHFS